MLLFSSRQAGPLHSAVRQAVRARRSERSYPSKVGGWDMKAPCCQLDGGGLPRHPSSHSPQKPSNPASQPADQTDSLLAAPPLLEGLSRQVRHAVHAALSHLLRQLLGRAPVPAAQQSSRRSAQPQETAGVGNKQRWETGWQPLRTNVCGAATPRARAAPHAHSGTHVIVAMAGRQAWRPPGRQSATDACTTSPTCRGAQAQAQAGQGRLQLWRQCPANNCWWHEEAGSDLQQHHPRQQQHAVARKQAGSSPCAAAPPTCSTKKSWLRSGRLPNCMRRSRISSSCCASITHRRLSA